MATWIQENPNGFEEDGPVTPSRPAPSKKQRTQASPKPDFLFPASDEEEEEEEEEESSDEEGIRMK